MLSRQGMLRRTFCSCRTEVVEQGVWTGRRCWPSGAKAAEMAAAPLHEPTLCPLLSRPSAALLAFHFPFPLSRSRQRTVSFYNGSARTGPRGSARRSLPLGGPLNQVALPKIAYRRTMLGPYSS